ncbi:hypothetical protein L833_5054 [Mycobacteroides abscessus MAB_091912_2446]|uniref:Uncharacterized protein n=1 Tax=Mycobacteroides abscessus MAB_091912_2446 TaxID=1335414 RepID=A0A829LYI3_9MYCO|nr:hypothetical protein L833_5054 [Mycobacteroides abscessus MAB_091912_2446]
MVGGQGDAALRVRMLLVGCRRKLRKKARASGLLREAAAALRASCSNSARGYTARLWSWLLVTINPPA